MKINVANFFHSLRTLAAMLLVDKDVLEEMKEAARERLSLFAPSEDLTEIAIMAVIVNNMKESVKQKIDPLEYEQNLTHTTARYVETLNLASLDESDARLVVRAMVNWFNRKEQKSKVAMDGNGFASIKRAAAISDAVQTCLRECDSYRRALGAMENSGSQELLSKVRDIRVLPWLAFDDFRSIFEEKLVDLAASGLLEQVEIAELRKVARPVLSNESWHGAFKLKRVGNQEVQEVDVGKAAPVIMAAHSLSNNTTEDISVRKDEEATVRKVWVRERNNLQDSITLFTDSHFTGALTCAFSEQYRLGYPQTLQDHLSGSLTLAYYNAAVEILAASAGDAGTVSGVQHETMRFATLSDQLIEQADQIDRRVSALGEMIPA